jgi:hypothetical protein
MIVISVKHQFEDGTNDQVGRFLSQAQGRYSDLSLSFMPVKTNLTAYTKFDTGYIIPCGEFLVYAVGNNRFTVTHLLEPEDHTNHGCSKEQIADISRDIKTYFESSRMHLLLLSRQQQPVAQLPEIQRAVAPPEIQRAIPVALPQVDVNQAVAQALAEERRRVETERKAEEERSAVAKKMEELLLQVKAAEEQNRKLMQRQDNNAPRNQGFNLTTEQLLVVLGVGLAMYFANNSNNTKMEVLATQTQLQLDAYKQRFENMGNFLYTQVANLQQQPTTTSVQRIDPPSSVDKKDPPAEPMSISSLLGNVAIAIAVLIAAFVAFLYLAISNERALDKYN